MADVMSTLLPEGFYTAWKARLRPAGACRESTDPPPERWLQQIWRHQRLCRDRLTTVDGQTVRVLHPGFWNREAGPDFRQAVVQVGEGPARTGDIELDLEVGHWQAHHHAGNPAYQQVLLRVVWRADTGSTGSPGPPVVPLQPYLDAPWAELIPWLEDEAGSLLPPDTLGRCCAPLRQTPPAVVEALVREAALSRLRRKAAEMTARARHAGWDRALWEGLFQALGYKHNGWPLRRVAEVVLAPGLESADLWTWEARLLGLSGLISPHRLGRGDGAGHVRRLWDSWWRERDRWSDQLLPLSVWRLAGVRPANHPQRRLALAARWLSQGTLPDQLQSWLLEDSGGTPAWVRGLYHRLRPNPEPDSYWNHHWTLRSPAVAGRCPLLGMTRSTDLAVNVILPWLHARTEAGRQSELRGRVEARYLAWPPGQENARLGMARNRLFGGIPPDLSLTAAMQQGLLQIVRDFCEPAGPLCSDCPFPSLVTAAAGVASGPGSG